MKNVNSKEIKQHYIAPSISINFVELEQGIAAGSANLRVGIDGALDTPEIEDWNNGGNVGDSDVEL
ncbi:hypothetical protein HZP44_14910 [Elizabethkingia anophelis]|nr:hypothetical protein [Elizabethkingia anophelis]MCT4209649.1 hypothetical protein [Elizabethkingia anophelis]